MLTCTECKMLQRINKVIIQEKSKKYHNKFGRHLLRKTYTGSGKKTSRIWRGRCVSCGGDTTAEGVLIDSGIHAICNSRNGMAR
jgi:hypothetical protein